MIVEYQPKKEKTTEKKGEECAVVEWGDVSVCGLTDPNLSWDDPLAPIDSISRSEADWFLHVASRDDFE